MANLDGNSVLRRKLAPRRDASASPAARAGDLPLGRAVSRAISDALPLVVEGLSAQAQDLVLDEMLDQLEPDAFMALLSAPAGHSGGFGLVALSQDGFGALIEAMTIGALSPRAAAARRPTQTDALLITDLIDTALSRLEGDDGFSGARFDRAVMDHRLLSILLEEGRYDGIRVTGRLVCGDVDRPFDMRFFMPHRIAVAPQPERDGQGTTQVTDGESAWHSALSDRVLMAPAVLRAELGHVSVPVGEAMALKPGDVLTLPLSALEEVALIDLDDQQQATGRLGQSRGMRAIRVTTWPNGPPPMAPSDAQITLPNGATGQDTGGSRAQAGEQGPE